MFTDSPAEDVYLDGPWSAADIEALSKVAIQRWPDVRFQYEDTEGGDYEPLPLDGSMTRGFCLMKTDAARLAWEAHGYTPEHAGTMLYVQLDPECLQITGDGDAMVLAQAMLDAVKADREMRKGQPLSPLPEFDDGFEPPLL